MSLNHAKILVADHDSIIVDSMSELLRQEGYDVEGASNATAALEKLQRHPFNLVISDVNMPDIDGFELLRTIKQRHQEIVVILITGYGTIESAVDAIKLGAYDYLTKPIIDDEIKLVVERALQQQALIVENQNLRDQLNRRGGLEHIIGQDYQMAKIFDVIETVADSRITVLITGASGTGKSLIARAIHRRSDRKQEPLIEVSCGAIPETLLESELFGHVKGSFTGAVADKEGKFKAADKGTLFLDEIASASPALQVKLLRVLQERQFEPVGSNETTTVDVRVILATNVDLQKEVDAGRFRQDLFYRINVLNIVLPPLVDRESDIPLLAQHFLNKYRGEIHKEVNAIDVKALDALQSYHWPGNVREIENVIERAMVFAKGRSISLKDLPPHLQEAAADSNPHPFKPQSLQAALAEPEKKIIEAALRANRWNRQATADALQINRTTLYKKMKHYSLDTPAARHRH